MKKVIYSVLVVLVLELVSCVSAPPPEVKPEVKPEAPAVVVPEIVPQKPVEVPLPDWTSEALLELDGVTYLVVSGDLEAPWSTLLSQAYQAAVGTPTDSFLADHPRPPTPDFVRDTKAWWKIALPPKPVEPPVVVDPSQAPEKEADSALGQGLFVAAIDGYVASVLVAMNSGRSDSNSRAATLLSKAVAALGKLQVAPQPGFFQTTTGTPFTQSFQVRVTSGSAPVSGVSVRFSAKMKKSGRLAVVGQTLITDASGIASYKFPTPDFSAKDEVVVVLDVNSWLEKLVNLPRELQDKLTALEALSASRRVSIPYTIESLSKGVPISLAFADFDEKGGLMKRGDSLSALSAQLTKSGYSTSNNTMNLSLLKSRDDATVLLAWLSQGKKTGRAVFGSANVTEVLSVDKRFTATVTGTLKVYDLETRKLVHQQKGGKSATGSDRTTAISAALQLLAADFVTVLNDELP